MAYAKRTWVSGEVITAVNMNRLEDGLETASTTADNAAAVAQNAVRSDIEQSLTDTKKALARRNIGAISEDELSNVVVTEIAPLASEMDQEITRIDNTLKEHDNRLVGKAEAADVAAVAAEIDVKINQLDQKIEHTGSADVAELIEDLSALTDRIEVLEQEAESTDIKADNKADLSDVADLAVEVDRQQITIDQLRSDIDMQTARIDGKADLSDVVGLPIEIDRISQQTDDTAQRVEVLEAAAKDQDVLLSTKAETVDLAAAVTELDHVNKRVDQAFEEIERKADAADAAGIAAAIDQHGILIDQLREDTDQCLQTAEAIDGKANVAETAGLAQAIDIVDNREIKDYQDVLQRLDNKADNVVLAQEIIANENNRLEVNKALDDKTDLSRHANELGALACNQDILQIQLDKHTAQFVETRVNELNLANDINTKVSKPSTEGSSGQILSTNGDGSTTWIDPMAMDEQTVGDAVSQWMDDHPDATTTVQDGSITLAKLGEDVRKILDSGADDFDAQIILNQLIGLLDPSMLQYTQEDLARIQVFKTWEQKLTEYSSYFSEPNGVGFLFFTDPHFIDGRSYQCNDLTLRKRIRLLKTMFEYSSARYLLCGGDWINNHYTASNAPLYLGQIQKILAECAGTKGYTVAGNHDYVYGETLTNLFTQEQISKNMFAGHPTYYVIDDCDDVGCYMLDTGGHSYDMTTERWEQIDWFASSLLTNTKPHLFGVAHMILFDQGDDPNHHIYYQDSYWTLTDITNNATKIADAFNQKASITLNGKTYNFSNATGTFHFMVSGHMHGDYNLEVNHIPCVLTGAFLFDILDCCFADFNSSVLHMVRAGHNGATRHIPIIPTGQYQTAGI